MTLPGTLCPVDHADPAGWRPGDPPDGPVELWVLVFADDGAYLGSARAAERPRWRWRDGRLALDYSPVRVVMRRRGVYATGLICAVDQRARVFRPLWPVSLENRRN